MEVIAIDPGNIKSGMVVMMENKIVKADITTNTGIMELILATKERKGVLVLYEDIKPYSARMGQQTVDTIKFIGQLEYVLNGCKTENKAVYRWEVKKWVYDRFGKICEPRIVKKILKRGLTGKDGEDRKSSFVFVDDRIVVAAMKEYWNIPKPKPGKKSLHGLSKHSWQALSIATFYIEAKKSQNLLT